MLTWGEVGLQAPISVEFMVTGKCQHRCTFCFVECGLNRGGVATAELPFKEKLDSIDKLANAGVFEVFLCGGEPSLVSIDILVERCIARGLRTILSSNGQSLDLAMAKRIRAAGLKEIQVSLQGTAAVHDKLCGTPGAFPIALAAIKNCISAGLEVTVSFLALKENCGVLGDLVRELDGLGVHSFRTLAFTVQSQEMLRMLPSLDQLATANASLIRSANNLKQLVELSLFNGSNHLYFNRLNPTVDQRGDNLNCQQSRFRLGRLFHPWATICHAGKTQLTILPDGTVVPCAMLDGESHHLGNIREVSLKDIWNSDKCAVYRQMSPADFTGRCGQCRQKSWCYSCRAIALKFTGDLLGEDVSCHLNRGDSLSPDLKTELESLCREAGVYVFGRFN